MVVFRALENPIIKPEDVTPSRPDLEIISAFNPAVARLGDEVILLLRVAERLRGQDEGKDYAPIFDVEKGEIVFQEFDKSDPYSDFTDPRVIVARGRVYLTSLSHLRVARSRDGIHFTVVAQPALFPENAYESYGIEDPRVTFLEGKYYVNYSAVSALGVATCLAVTEDFHVFTRLGVIFPPNNKDVVIFPEKIQGKYFALHRPDPVAFGVPEIWLAESPDLIHWGRHRLLLTVREGSWDSRRLGAGAVPFRIPEGWLEIYHGVDENSRYCLGALLLDAKEPWKVLARSRRPILAPEAEYERRGFFGHVVFTCGALYEEGMVKIYYGTADTCVGYAEIPLTEILNGF